MERQRRTPRESLKPRLRNGKPTQTEVTDADKLHLRPILERHAFLPADFICALMREHVTVTDRHFRKHLKSLAVEPVCWLAHPEKQYDHKRGLYRYGVYGLPTTPVPRLFFHNLKADCVMAQLRIGARDSNLDFIEFERIFAKAPPASQHLPMRDPMRPRTIHIRHTLPGTHAAREYIVTPDADPFGIGDGTRAWFFFGPEIDLGNEPKNSRESRRASIRRKVSLCIAMHEQEIWSEVYGLPHPMFYPFVFETEGELKTVIDVINQETKGDGFQYIILNHYPDFRQKKQPEPDGALLHSTWMRAWQTDFQMDRL